VIRVHAGEPFFVFNQLQVSMYGLRTDGKSASSFGLFTFPRALIPDSRSIESNQVSWYDFQATTEGTSIRAPELPEIQFYIAPKNCILSIYFSGVPNMTIVKRRQIALLKTAALTVLLVLPGIAQKGGGPAGGQANQQGGSG
jgi:hypothetical protein